MSEYTPGPWQACELWVCEENDPGHNVGICRVEKRPGCKANARLIAAAPEYAAAVQEMLDYEDHGGDGWWTGWDKLKAAHAKATGRS